jgi:hypothetical protein
MAQIKMIGGQSQVIRGGAVFVSLPDGSTVMTATDAEIVVVAANEYNLVAITVSPPVQVSPTSPVTIGATGTAAKS